MKLGGGLEQVNVEVLGTGTGKCETGWLGTSKCGTGRLRTTKCGSRGLRTRKSVAGWTKRKANPGELYRGTLMAPQREVAGHAMGRGRSVAGTPPPAHVCVRNLDISVVA